MKFYGQFNPPVDKYIYDTFFKKEERKNKGFFIECGAFDGETECSCKFFEETLNWKGINIEPSPVVYEKLIANRPLATNINYALSNKRGKQCLHLLFIRSLGRCVPMVHYITDISTRSGWIVLGASINSMKWMLLHIKNY